nr:UDP-N-acetylglucosamine/UDP-glucose/GDP-mannose transporter isoform X2 [Geotrypetes seraphini]XP_033784205.1 UDP-N-acetylglucosamine/UDP-glucose/GDP-mannose transporter isoform X2 [Geotrypetes seraphini]
MVLGIGQMGVTIIILYVAKLKNFITFPDFNKQIPRKLFPLPLIYIGNHLSGLASTQKLSLPMFTVLRKFAIPITLVLETIVLRKRYPLSIILSVCTIVVGAVIAAGFDLSFQLEGYLIALLSNIFTAANGVYIAIKIDPKELGKYGVLFYNASFVIIPTLFVSFITGDIHKAIEFEQWRDIVFCTQFLLSCFMGFILLYSVVLCCYYNSPLTTMVSGAIKNICIAYIGIFIGGDYTFSWLNFIGLNICMSGGLSYSILIMMSNPRDFDPVNISNNEEKYSKQDETCNGLSESEEAKPLIISDEE